jgi:hypothetical protein
MLSNGGPVRLLLGLPLALVLAGCAQGTSSQPAPLQLRLVGKSLPMEASAAGSAVGYGGGYTLSGTLPTGPANAPVFIWTSGTTISDTTVSNLGKAFGVTGKPVRHTYGWALTNSFGEIHVRDGAGAQWSFTSTADTTFNCGLPAIDIDHPATDGVISSCAVGVGVAASGPGAVSGIAQSDGVAKNTYSVVSGSPMTSPRTAPTPPPIDTGAPVPPPTPIPVDLPLVPADLAHSIADPVLKDLGIVGPETVRPGMGTANVRLDPAVGGMPTQGISTWLQVDRTQVTFASGWLTLPAASDAYPLVTANQAFKDLANRPVPEMMIACPQPAIPSPATAMPLPCPSPTPTVITGAELGLELNYDMSGAPLLVPSWFFHAADNSYPITSIAVDPSYLATPTPAPTPSDVTSGGSVGGSGGSPAPGTSIIPPTESATTPAKS